jgi:segregation and condensation protein B
VAENKIPIATDSEAELHELIGDDATATFESDPNFVNSNPTADASSDHLELRDTDDMEDSDEEEDEAGLEDDEDEDDDEGEDEDDEDEDEDDGEFEDEEEEDDPDELRTAEPRDVHGPGKHSRTDIEKELEEMEDEVGEENVEEAPEMDEEEEGEERPHANRAIDEALRMSATVTNGRGSQGWQCEFDQVG